MSEVKYTGRCLCGEVRFEVDGAASAAGHCHCFNCQRATGSAYWTWITFQAAHVRWTASPDRLGRFEQTDTHAVRSFCRGCGTPMAWQGQDAPDELDLSLVLFDAPPDCEPAKHAFADRAPRWSNLGDDLPRFGGREGKERLPS